MKRRFRALMCVFAVLAVAVLLFRPITLDALGAPYGAHFSPDVQLTKAEGSPHCSILADCETVSISNVGLDLGQTGIALVLSGIVVMFVMPRRLTGRSWTALVPVRPPLSLS